MKASPQFLLFSTTASTASDAQAFLPVQLSLAQCQQYEALARRLLQRALGDYDAYVHEHHRRVDKRQWKQVRAKESIVVFSATASATKAAAAAATVVVPPHRLLAVGQLVGSLDDAMLGDHAPTAAAMSVQACYDDDAAELVDARVLYEIHGPTRARPFQFLGIKWLVMQEARSTLALSSSMVRPRRDCVVLEFAGTLERANGERIGYRITHPVELPQCPELDGVTRCRRSTSWLGKQRSYNTTELFVNAQIPATAATASAIHRASVDLTANRNLAVRAQCIKLAWLLRSAAATAHRADKLHIHDISYDEPVRTSLSDECELCAASVSVFKSLVTCELCLARVCRRCVSTRKIAHARRCGAAAPVRTRFCTSCVTTGVKTSAAMVASDESAHDHENDGGDEDAATVARTASSRGRDEYPTTSEWRQSSRTESESSIVWGEEIAWGEEVAPEHSMMVMPSIVSPTKKEREMKTDADVVTSSPPVEDARIAQLYRSSIRGSSGDSPVRASGSSCRGSDVAHAAVNGSSFNNGNARQFQLFEQMQRLRCTAERTYMQTKQTGMSMKVTQLS